MVNLFACDDQKDQLLLIHDAASEYFKRHEIDASITLFSNPMEFLESLEKAGGCDIAILDVCMPGFLGTDIAREIRRREDKTEFFFLSNSSEYAVDAYALKAAHYLLKPITQTRFDEAMNRVMERLEPLRERLLTVKGEGGEIRRISLDDILFIESHAHGQDIHQNGGTIIVSRSTLSHLFTEISSLSPNQFISPYKGFIVNLKSIQTIETKRIILRSGDVIPLPRGTFMEVKTRYFSFLYEKEK